MVDQIAHRLDLRGRKSVIDQSKLWASDGISARYRVVVYQLAGGIRPT